VFLTEIQRNLLLEAYISGMVRYSSVDENATVNRVAKKTGLTVQRVKVFFFLKFASSCLFILMSWFEEFTSASF